MAAARLRQSAGISANLEATMAARGLIDHTPATKAELRAHDPEFLREEQQQAVAGYEAQLKWLEAEGERKARANAELSGRNYDKEQAIERQKAEQQKVQRENFAKSEQEAAQRRAIQKQQLAARMEAMQMAQAGRIQ